MTLIERLKKFPETRSNESLQYEVTRAKATWDVAIAKQKMEISDVERQLNHAIDCADLYNIVVFENRLAGLKSGLEIAEKYYNELFPAA